MNQKDYEEVKKYTPEQFSAHHLGYKHGMDAGKQLFIKEILKDSRALQVLRALRGKASNIVSQYGREKDTLTSYTNEQLSAYSDALRHCINTLIHLGDPLDNYNQTEHENFKDSVKLELTEEDVKYYN